MSFWSDVGNFFKDPGRAFTAVATGGLSEAARAAGLKKQVKTVERIYGGTAAGVAAGFVAGGPAGAVVGGASGFGRGVAAELHGESSTDALKGGLIYGGLTGGITGAITGQGAAGYVRQQLVKGAVNLKAPSGSISETLKTGGLLAFLNSAFKQNAPQALDKLAGSIPSLPIAGDAGSKALKYLSGQIGGGATVPLPSPPTNVPVPVATEAQIVSNQPSWLIWAALVLAVGAYLYFRKKRRHA